MNTSEIKELERRVKAYTKWEFQENNQFIEFSYWCNFGNGSCIQIDCSDMSLEDVIEELYKYWEDYDSDQVARELIGCSHLTVRQLIEDCEEEEEQLEKLWYGLKFCETYKEARV